VSLRTRSPRTGEPTVQVARKRFRRRRIRGRLAAMRSVLLAIAAVAALGGLAWLFFFSSVLAFEKVDVTGIDVVSDAQIRGLATAQLGEPLARVDTDAIQARIEDLAAVKSVDVSRCWPHKICIDVTERQAVAVVDKEGTLWGLDDTGILFRQYARRPSGLPSVHMMATTSTDALAEAAKVIAALPSSVSKRVDYLDVRTVDEIALRLRNGALVTWGSSDDSVNKARVLGPLLTAEPGGRTYNVSVPGSPTVSGSL
jgi:cell division protein FtsQ